MAKLLTLRAHRPEDTAPGRGLDQSEAATVAACAAGDPRAMGALFDDHHEAVRRFLARLGVPRTDLEDMVQSTFLEAFRAARRFRSASQVRTWLFGVAVNVSRHHFRGESRRRAFLDLWEREPEESPGAAARPDRAAESQQLVARLASALGALPPDLRAAFVVCDVEGLSGAEAAQVLDVRPGTLGRRLHEARRALRAAVGEGWP